MTTITTRSPTSPLPPAHSAPPQSAANFQKALNSKSTPSPAGQPSSGSAKTQKLGADRVQERTDTDNIKTDGSSPSRRRRQAPEKGNFDPNLENRLKDIREHTPAGERERYVQDSSNFQEFIHEVSEGTRRGAVVTNVSTNVASSFTNSYSRDRWVFEANERGVNEPYFASNVTRVQYQAVAESGIINMGDLPSQIVRSNVINENTNSFMYDALDSMESPDQLLQTFLEETINGRSTQRILNDFGLQANSIRISENSIDLFDSCQDPIDHILFYKTSLAPCSANSSSLE